MIKNDWNHGVPQRTISGPLVFLLYINDFRKRLRGNFDTIQLADDISLHFSRNNFAEQQNFFLKYWRKKYLSKANQIYHEYRYNLTSLRLEKK